MSRNDHDDANENKRTPSTKPDSTRESEETAQRVSSPAGEAYRGDHKNHGEPEVDDEDLIEEIDLDELPDSEGPDA